MTPAIDLHSFPLRQRESPKIVRRHGEVEQKWMDGPANDIPNISQSSIGDCRILTQANHFGQYLSTFSSKGLPPS
jgi:hypothetical protein